MNGCKDVLLAIIKQREGALSFLWNSQRCVSVLQHSQQQMQQVLSLCSDVQVVK